MTKLKTIIRACSQRLLSKRFSLPGRVLVSACVCLAALSGCAGYGSSSGTNLKSTPRYGAIAYSPSTQRWHIRRNVIDANRAATLAIKNCAAADCVLILSFGPGQCGTFSLGDNGALGVGTGKTKETAKNAALSICGKSGQMCKVAPAQCNG